MTVWLWIEFLLWVNITLILVLVLILQPDPPMWVVVATPVSALLALSYFFLKGGDRKK